MSGRGGARGGRGGGAARGGGPGMGRMQVAGVDVSWDLTGMEIEYKPQDLFPKMPPPQAPPPTEKEKACVRHYRIIRDRIHNSPLYTVLPEGTNLAVKRKASDGPIPVEPTTDPFTATETYSARYLKKRRTLPKLDFRPYALHLFPKELHSVLDPTLKKGAKAGAKPKKLFDVADNNMVTRLERIKAKTMAEEAFRNAKDGSDDEDEEEEEEKPEGEEEPREDDDLSAASTDSEDSDDDYNAERYFEDGEADEDDGEGGDNDYYD